MTTVPESVMRVTTFDINEMGQITRKLPKLDREEQLENTLLQGLYPDIRVARLNVPPGRLEAFQEALVEKSMTGFDADGVRYKLVGASASAKSGKFYAVDERYERADSRPLPELAASRCHLLRDSGCTVQTADRASRLQGDGSQGSRSRHERLPGLGFAVAIPALRSARSPAVPVPAGF